MLVTLLFVWFEPWTSFSPSYHIKRRKKSRTLQPWWEPPFWFTSICVRLGEDAGSRILRLTVHPPGICSLVLQAFIPQSLLIPSIWLDVSQPTAMIFSARTGQGSGWLSLRDSRIYDGRRFDLLNPAPPKIQDKSGWGFSTRQPHAQSQAQIGWMTKKIWGVRSNTHRGFGIRISG